MSGEEETAYHDQHLTLRDGRFVTKHIYAGQTRIASKMDPDWFRDPPTLYYHPDHLGSTSFASNNEQTLTQRDEYFPSGELWIDASDSRYELRRAYVFTGKELDQATGLYYFGARYYDPRSSVWLSPDPILDEYMEGGPGGGVFNPGNLGLYSYTLNNPVNLVDPDGRQAQGGHRNFPPGSNGERSPNGWYGPEAARYNQIIQAQRIAEQQAQGKVPTSSAPAPVPPPAAQQRAPSSPPPPPAQPPRPAPPAQPAKASAAQPAKAPVAAQPAKAPVAAQPAKPPQAAPQQSDSSSTTAKAGVSAPVRNGHLAGKPHPVTGVPFDSKGFPDFRAAGVVAAEVKITPSGTRPGDFAAANRAAGLKETPSGMTRHHHQDGRTMQLVPRAIHQKTGHTGGFVSAK
ncbi:conserved carbohydrate-binding protein, Rhs family [Sorangium cellulosum So ce56]|uniref:Conserved carbohydrate-binding protein, Rhs family n=1 Tax=Sorangium cellulosum (strain So ce56) TaxID=448385 RepID=A9GXW3_SORC5|nr:RHS repeat-associated core domain-containing protein [Sorangium cellulosum]CAN97151.1 conserved carbohydrate-binding protein, Rhs family [Sorangium cellulosum So ce56]